MHVATRRSLLSRRAAGGAWSPLDLASLTLWLDASDVTTLFTDAGSTQVSSDGDRVYQWNDKSTSGFDVSQATEADRPTYQAAELNGLSVLRAVAGTPSDRLERASVAQTDLVGTNTATLVFVVNQVGTSGQNGLGVLAPSSGTELSVWATHNDTIYFDYGGYTGGARVSVAQPAGWDNAWHILVLRRDGTSARIYVDGGSAILDNTAFSTNLTNGSATLRVLCHTSGTEHAPGFTGDLAEQIVCDTALSTSDLNALGGYLAAKWGLTWTDVS